MEDVLGFDCAPSAVFPEADGCSLAVVLIGAEIGLFSLCADAGAAFTAA